MEVCTCFSIVVLPIIPQIKALQYFDVAEDELYDPPKKEEKKEKKENGVDHLKLEIFIN